MPPFVLRRTEAHTTRLPTPATAAGYNELVLDTWRYPWADDVTELVEAVFVQANATPKSVEFGRQLHAAFLHATGQQPQRVPLVRYDATAAREPFKLIDDYFGSTVQLHKLFDTSVLHLCEANDSTITQL